VEVEVIDTLAGFMVAIHQGTITALRDSQLARYLLCGQMDLSHEHRILRTQVVQGSDMTFRDDQYMDRGLGMDVVKGKHVIVFIDRFGRDSA
jgi:hypothetical protein